MTPIEPRVAIFSNEVINKPIVTSDSYYWLAKNLEVHIFKNDIDYNLLVNNRFNLIVIIGNKALYRNALKSLIPKLYLDSSNDLNGDIVYNAYINGTLSDINPKISIFTPTYNTFKKFNRAYRSVIAQSEEDWEWVILDDSPDNENYDYIKNVIGNDSRIKLYKKDKRDGFVGSTKRQAASLCSGEYFLEFDHDDELHDRALEFTLAAFKRFPDAGFCYSDSAEVFETGGCVRYGNGFGMGHGKHYTYYYKGRELVGSRVPVNSDTIRHIVGVPNHLRCWERETYFSLQRHNNKLAIVDDYEFLVRTFLKTKFIHIPEVLYIQYMNAGGNNTQEPRRAEIQRLVDRIQKYYDKQIHERVIELGQKDFMWDELTQTSDLNKRNPLSENFAYVYKV